MENQRLLKIEDKVNRIDVNLATLIERLSDYPKLKERVDILESTIEGARNRFWGAVGGAGLGGGGIGAAIVKWLSAGANGVTH